MNSKRTTGKNKDFVSLVRELDAYLAEKDGDEHTFYATYNTLDAIKHVVVIYIDDTAVGCGAFKSFDQSAVEVKRMFTLPQYRGHGIASLILTELENWARELGYQRCVLETGKRQPEAITLYIKRGYTIIPNYGQYTDMDNSVCFEKLLYV